MNWIFKICNIITSFAERLGRISKKQKVKSNRSLLLVFLSKFQSEDMLIFMNVSSQFGLNSSVLDCTFSSKTLILRL